jgi:hypothetical protein
MLMITIYNLQYLRCGYLKKSVFSFETLVGIISYLTPQKRRG